jgi:hypothetical protein
MGKEVEDPPHNTPFRPILTHNGKTRLHLNGVFWRRKNERTKPGGQSDDLRAILTAMIEGDLVVVLWASAVQSRLNLESQCSRYESFALSA